MRRIKKNYEIVNNTVRDFKTGTQQHIENAIQETAHMLLKSMYPDFVDTNGSICILNGCINTGSGSNYIISAGVVSYKDPNFDEIELFYVNTSTFTVTGGNTAVAVINTVSYTGNGVQGDVADPTGMSDNTVQNVHDIRTIDIINGNSGSPNYIGDFSSFIQAQKNVIKLIDSVTTGSISTSEVVMHSITPSGNNVKKLQSYFNASFLVNTPAEIVIKLYYGATVTGHTPGTIGGTVSGGTLIKTVSFNLGVTNMGNALATLISMADYTGGQTVTITGISSAGTPSIQNNSDFIIDGVN